MNINKIKEDKYEIDERTLNLLLIDMIQAIISKQKNKLKKQLTAKNGKSSGLR